jgi:predicted enzyme related to lactoylglutathione lyase
MEKMLGIGGVKGRGAMVAQLRAAGIAVKADPRPFPIGRFSRLEDPEGNPIELWQPKVGTRGEKSSPHNGVRP